MAEQHPNGYRRFAGLSKLRPVAGDGCVEIEGSGVEPPEPPAYPDIAEAIIEAVVDEHSIATSNGTRTFSATKRSFTG